MNSKPVLCAAALAFACFATHAQTQAPGLWEHSFRMKGQGGEMDQARADMQKEMAGMSPQQRKQVEQMMGSRGVAMGGPGSTTKMCITKEQAARPAEPRLDGDCTHRDVQRSGSTMKFKFECTKPQPSSGEGEMSYPSDKAYAGKMTTHIKGQPQPMAMEMSGKWLSADCGDVKPSAMPSK